MSIAQHNNPAAPERIQVVVKIQRLSPSGEFNRCSRNVESCNLTLHLKLNDF
jgi:hypothetical protein